MTPRERVLAALDHRPTDRVPVDFGGHRSSGIAALAYPRLRSALGLPPRPIRVYDPIQQLAIIDDDVLERFQIDTIELGRGFALEDRHWADWTLPDGTPCQMPAWALPERVTVHEGRGQSHFRGPSDDTLTCQSCVGRENRDSPRERLPERQEEQWVLRSRSGRVLAKMPRGAIYFEQCYWPFLENDSFERLPEALNENMWCAVPSPPGPLAAGPDGQRILAEGARRLRERTDRAIVGLFGGNLLEIGQFLYRNDNFLMLLAGDPKRAHEFLDRLVEIHLANLERFLQAVGPHIDIVVFGDDLGMQTGPQISPAMYREFLKPRHARLWRRAKQLADVKVMLHCCGGVRPLIPDLIEAGLDAINPVQISCAGMDAQGLKRDFGDRLTFWGGGCDTGSVLSRGTPAEVRQHVSRQVSILSLGGGFVFQQVHNVLADVPPENIIAMFDAANEQ